MYFVKLTYRKGGDCFVNLEKVCEMNRQEGAVGTKIFYGSLPGDEWDFIEVKETCEEIMEMCPWKK